MGGSSGPGVSQAQEDPRDGGPRHRACSQAHGIRPGHSWQTQRTHTWCPHGHDTSHYHLRAAGPAPTMLPAARGAASQSYVLAWAPCGPVVERGLPWEPWGGTLHLCQPLRLTGLQLQRPCWPVLTGAFLGLRHLSLLPVRTPVSATSVPRARPQGLFPLCPYHTLAWPRLAL